MVLAVSFPLLGRFCVVNDGVALLFSGISFLLFCGVSLRVALVGHIQNFSSLLSLRVALVGHIQNFSPPMSLRVALAGHMEKKLLFMSQFFLLPGCRLQLFFYMSHLALTAGHTLHLFLYMSPQLSISLFQNAGNLSSAPSPHPR